MVSVLLYGWNGAYKKVVIHGVEHLAPARIVEKFFGYDDGEFPAGLVQKFLMAI